MPISHDHKFASSLAERIIDIQPEGIIDFSDSYDDYLHSQWVV
ncbi:hypothetical protein QT231_10025 [Halomonas sp. SpR1]|nr:hypothetical protein [Halomonas sp. SpR1]MDQ7733035.1 hypothetical protein [Halomonas sp. SpR1]